MGWLMVGSAIRGIRLTEADVLGGVHSLVGGDAAQLASSVVALKKGFSIQAPRWRLLCGCVRAREGHEQQHGSWRGSGQRPKLGQSASVRAGAHKGAEGHLDGSQGVARSRGEPSCWTKACPHLGVLLGAERKLFATTSAGGGEKEAKGERRLGLGRCRDRRLMLIQETRRQDD